jgi:hypothetical protein
MDDKETRSFNFLVEQYLGQRLPKRLASLIAFPELPKEARNFILRMLSLMHQAGYPPTEFTPMLIRMISEIIPNTLPAAWGGRIPPLTMPGRHQKFDAYVAKQTWPSMAEKPVFVDIGCGFPPQTTLDTARQFPDWQVIGVDRDFAPYIVYDHEGNYACYDRHGHFQYFQPRVGGEWLALYAHPDKTRERFSKLFAYLSPLLQSKGNKKSNTLEKNGHRIIQHHIRDFETGNLTFRKSEIKKIQLPSACVIRCMNVFLYANKESRKKMLQRLSEFLCDGGILIAGTNGNDIHARYIVYRKKNDETTPEEFSFSPDNLRPLGFMPWFTIHDKDPEATYLAELTVAIRADTNFWPVFSKRFDELLAECEICQRGADGFLHLPEAELQVTEVMVKMKQIWRQIIEEGYVEGAVEALRLSGYIAWQNEVGDVAVRPSREVFSML